MKRIKPRDSVDILSIYKEYLVDKRVDDVVIDMCDFQENEEAEVRLVLKFEELARKKGMSVKFVNQNGRIKEFKIKHNLL